jgi:hypothetical protein
VRVPGEAYLPDADEWDVLLTDIGARPVPRSKVELVTGEDSLPRRTDGRGSSFYFQGTLREDHTIPGVTTLVEAGDEIQAQPSPRKPGWYLVSKPNTPGEAEVPGAMLEMDLALPPSTSQVELMCYELAPYAAALARLRPGFVAAANSRSGSSAGGSEYWAETLGTDFGTEKVLWTDLPARRLQRGDLVAFYASGVREGEDTSTHVAVATGDGQDVYSLWNRPQHYPVRVGLAELWAGETTMPRTGPRLTMAITGCQLQTLPPPGRPDRNAVSAAAAGPAAFTPSWELSTLAAAWHHAYGGQRPDLARALEFYDRWLPGIMRRIATITRTCVPECATRRRSW